MHLELERGKGVEKFVGDEVNGVLGVFQQLEGFEDVFVPSDGEVEFFVDEPVEKSLLLKRKAKVFFDEVLIELLLLNLSQKRRHFNQVKLHVFQHPELPKHVKNHQGQLSTSRTEFDI